MNEAAEELIPSSVRQSSISKTWNRLGPTLLTTGLALTSFCCPVAMMGTRSRVGHEDAEASGLRSSLLLKLVLIAGLILCLAAPHAWANVATDASVSTDLAVAGTQIATPTFSTLAGNELLLAFIATDSKSSPMTVTSVTGGGLTWVPVARANSTGGTSEIWRAFAVSSLSNVIVTANFPQSVFASIQVMSFSGVDTSGINGSGAIGAVATASARGAPSVSLTTTRANSVVFGVGNDYDNAIARTLGSGQTLVHQDLSHTNNDTYWMQRLTNPVAVSGTHVTISDTAPTADQFNFAICEILAPSGTAAPSIISLTPNTAAVGASVVIAGSNFGPSQGNGGVTFNGTPATIASWTNTSITAVVPYGATNGNVVVAAGDGISSNGVSFTVTAGSGGLAIDASAVGDLSVAGTHLTTTSFSTSGSNEHLLALIATDAQSAGMTVTSISGGGLTWVLVKRTNTQSGDAEIWRSFAASPLSNISVTATLSQSVVGSIQVLSFTGADASGTNGSGAIGAVAGGNANPGAPTASLVTTRANSWVFGVGNDYDRSISRTVGAGQTLLHQYWSPTNDTYWMQRRNNANQASGTSVTINDTAPVTDRYNLAIVEILPASTAAPVISSLAPPAGQVGDVITVSGSNFGATRGSSTVTFGGVVATPTSWSSTQIMAPVPAGVAIGSVPVLVTTAGGASNSVSFNSVTQLSVTASPSPAPNSAGWNNSNVTITYVCFGGVTPVICPSAKTIATEGANQVITATATDADGNSAVASVTLSIDKTVPTISATVTPAANIHGVVTAPATISFTCSDGLSGVNACPAQIQVTTTGANQSFSGTVTDKAGNAASSTLTLTVQSAPLAISASESPASNAAGWNNTSVTVSYTCTGGVPPVVCPGAQTVSTEGASQVVNGTASDAAGQTATASVTLNIDKTVPSIAAAVTPAANANGVVTAPATINFTCSDTLSGVAGCAAPIQVASVGLNQPFSGTATDKAGNTATTSVTVSVQSTPLTIAASASPAPNAAGWNNSNVTVSYTCMGGVPPRLCPSPQIVSSEGASQSVTATATDAAGQTASAAVTLNIDKTPPSINITSPPNGSNVAATQVTVQGLVTDALSGVTSVTCNGISANVTGTAFSCQISLATGGNNVAIQAGDVAGNSATSNVSLNFSIPISIQITTPAPLQLFSSNPITVTGTVDKPNATVTVGGVTATVNNGTFAATGVTLRESKNLLTATAVSPDGGVGSNTVTVFLDTNPPVAHIDSPVEGIIVNTPQVDVMGNVNDLVTGTVNGDQVSVSVNGVTANVANRSFAAHGILLVPGVNTITAVATDRAGNTSQHQVHVTLRSAEGQQAITVISGNNQGGPISTVLPQPLVVRVTDALGRPMANVRLTFTVAKSDGLLSSGQQSGRTLIVATDGNGNAAVQFQLGSRNGAGINQVAVSAPGFVGQAVFAADGTVGPATQIHSVSGEVQRGAVGMPLAEPLVAIVFDAGGNPVANVPVTFTVQSGGGLINTQTAFTQNTDNDGKASAALILGLQEGINNNVVTASFNGITGQPAVFTSSGVVPGPAANTTLSGIVMDDANQPIVNATASIKGTNLSALTNASGRFTIASVPVGDLVLFVDGSTSSNSEVYPTLSFQIATVPGIENTLPSPIYLPEIDTDNSQVVGGDQDVVLTMKGVAGVQYRVFAHSVTFPDGSHTGRLTLSQVHADKVPMTPPNGTAPRLVGTLQPAGVKFDPPIQMTLPNTDGLAPGQITELFSFHHDVEQFVTEGTAHVSEDGSVIVSDPGFGLTVSGWHGGGGQPQPGTCASTCNCGVCIGGLCVPAIGGSLGDKCDPNDACIVNGKCNILAVCTGDKKEVTDLTIFVNGNDASSIGKVFAKANNPVTFGVKFAAANCKSEELTFNWSFDDGGTAVGPTITHTFTSAGGHAAAVTAKCRSCGAKTAHGFVTALDVTFQTASGQGFSSTPRIGVPGTTYQKTTFRAVVTPADEAGNISIGGLGINVPQQTTSGSVITFDAAGSAPSSTLGDMKITALHSSGVSFDQAATVVIPKQIGTPHDTTGGGVIVSHALLDESTSPACPQAQKGIKVCLTVIAIRQLTMTVWDQFQQPIGDVYAGAPVTESGVKINQFLSANSTYIDPTGVGSIVDIVFVSNPEVAGWPNAALPALQAGPPIDDSVAIEIDGFALNPAAVSRIATFAPPNILTIIWP